MRALLLMSVLYLVCGTSNTFSSVARSSRVSNARYTRLLRTYERELRNIPGACKIIKTLQNMQKSGDTENMQGHLFELEVAALLQHRGIHICGLDVSTDDGICEFDIITNKRLIECKNVNMRHNSRLHEQVLRQKAIADELKKKYVVYFKNSISPELHNWFRAHSIAYRIFNT